MLSINLSPKKAKNPNRNAQSTPGQSLGKKIKQHEMIKVKSICGFPYSKSKL